MLKVVIKGDSGSDIEGVRGRSLEEMVEGWEGEMCSARYISAESVSVG